MHDIDALMRSMAEGTGLRVRVHADLRGASVAGPQVQAYVVPAKTGWQICFWHPTGANPYRIFRTEALDEAVDLAIAAALRPQSRKVWRAGHPPPAASGTLHRHIDARREGQEVQDGQVQR